MEYVIKNQKEFDKILNIIETYNINEKEFEKVIGSSTSPIFIREFLLSTLDKFKEINIPKGIYCIEHIEDTLKLYHKDYILQYNNCKSMNLKLSPQDTFNPFR